jgi:GNAT superfamily N-acetyltransferase
MRPEIFYRPIRPQDGSVLVRVHRRSILLEGVKAYTPDIARSWAVDLKPEGYWRHAEGGERFELAITCGAIAGFCSTREDEIKGLYVDPAFLRMGVAGGLMRRALKRLRVRGHSVVRVMAALSGVKFYEAMGFEPVAARMHPTRGGAEMLVVEMSRREQAAVPLRVHAEFAH